MPNSSILSDELNDIGYNRTTYFPESQSDWTFFSWPLSITFFLLRTHYGINEIQMFRWISTALHTVIHRKLYFLALEFISLSSLSSIFLRFWWFLALTPWWVQSDLIIIVVLHSFSAVVCIRGTTISPWNHPRWRRHLVCPFSTHVERVTGSFEPVTSSCWLCPSTLFVLPRSILLFHVDDSMGLRSLLMIALEYEFLTA